MNTRYPQRNEQLNCYSAPEPQLERLWRWRVSVALDAFVLLIGLAGCQARHSDSARAQGGDVVRSYPNEEFNASIVQILAHREQYHGKRVRVYGYLRLEPEGTAVYLSKDDADYRISANGFWISFHGNAIPNKTAVQYDRKYVLIEGRFDKDNRGHTSAWQGAIEDVDRVLEMARRD